MNKVPKILKIYLKMNVEGKKRRGKSKKRWLDTIDN
jgi:hypothetical protein